MNTLARFLTGALAAVLTGPAFGAGGYSLTRSITVAAAVVPSTQTNFPMLVYGTYSYLATVANSGLIQNTTTLNSQTVPADLIFTSDSGCATLLNWEVASYSATTGAIGVWVQVPSLSNGTVIYMCYDNAAITTYQGNAASTWDTNYKAVFHLSNGTTLSGTDSTASANNGTITAATATTGQVDGAASFNGTTAMIDAGAASSLANIFASGGTVEMWADILGAGGNSAGRLLNKTPSGDTAPAVGWQLIAAVTGSAYGPRLQVGVNGSGTTGSWNINTAGNAESTWYSFAITYSSASLANVPTIYQNGSSQTLTSSTQPTGTIASDTAAHLVIGNQAAQTRGVNGTIDEVRISSTIRSANWITTEYNNQSSPSTFYTVGAAAAIATGYLIIWEDPPC